eukprot:2574094-Rhodomonas_salina.1
MPGTGVAHDAISLRACCVMSVAETAQGAMCLRACYAMSGTKIACGDRQCHVLSPRAGSYCHTLSQYRTSRRPIAPAAGYVTALRADVAHASLLCSRLPPLLAPPSSAHTQCSQARQPQS